MANHEQVGQEPHETELTLNELQDMKVADLKKALKERGLGCTGNKPELVLRLQHHVKEQTGNDTLESMDDADITGELGEILDDSAVEPDVENIEPPKKILLTHTTDTNSGAEETKIVTTNLRTQPATDSEKARKRAERFSAESHSDDKKATRAARFGMTDAVNKTGTMTETEKLTSRSNRFAQTNKSTASVMETSDRAKARSERFNLPSPVTENADDKLRKRQEKFGTTPAITTVTGKISMATSVNDDDEARKRKRAARFGVS